METTFIKSRGKSTNVREVQIKDLSDNEIQIVLWGKKATDFDTDAVYDKQNPKAIVVLFVGCLPKRFQNKAQLTGGSACQWYFNPNILEAQPFYDSLRSQRIELHEPLPDPPKIGETQKCFQLEHKSLRELNDMNPYDFQDEGFQVTVTITRLPETNDWWYPACEKCRCRSYEQEEGGYRCPECNWTEIEFRYKLNFFANDEDTEAKLFCFDTVARQIVRRNCRALLNPLKTTTGLPSELTAIISKKFTFGVTLTKDSYHSKTSRTYLINSIIARFDQQTSASTQIPGQKHQNLPMLSKTQNVASVSNNLLKSAQDQNDLLQEHSDSVEKSTPPPLSYSDRLAMKGTHSQSAEQRGARLPQKRLFHGEDQTDQQVGEKTADFEKSSEHSEEPTKEQQSDSQTKRPKAAQSKGQSKTSGR